MKRIITAAAIVGTAVALAACGGTSIVNPPTTPTASTFTFTTTSTAAASPSPSASSGGGGSGGYYSGPGCSDDPSSPLPHCAGGTSAPATSAPATSAPGCTPYYGNPNHCAGGTSAPATSAPATSSGSTSCSGITINSATSCAFAEKVQAAYDSAVGQAPVSTSVTAYSPVTNQTYTEQCNVESEDASIHLVSCSHGSDSIQFTAP